MMSLVIPVVETPLAFLKEAVEVFLGILARLLRCRFLTKYSKEALGTPFP